LFRVTFTETGVPSGKAWSVAFDGTRKTGTSTSLSFSVANGTYGFLVAGPNGSVVSGSAPAGNLTVNGKAIAHAVKFVAGTTYSVTFTETGLPAKTSWCVTFGAKTCVTTATLVFRNLTDGTYPFSVAPISGYTVSPSTGFVKVSGASAKVTVKFT